ncbi:hypothetical protein RRG08_032775 [Elysia crispata]|uniref:G-protein coupled receptors family 1 profile domain-containing protein n=1 Tax=Elysia crispata TaxID=231223 RepID=A0AAE0YNF6_9GAST|nr:hypothetical protein RRG08_032775 [Elysia crispata]
MIHENSNTHMLFARLFHQWQKTLRIGITEILKQIYLYSLPILCIAGVLGNALAFLVFVSKSFRRTSCSWYLAARAVSDGGFLLATFLMWASDATKLGYFHTDFLCQLLVFFPYLFGFLSVWLTVVVTVENYIRICKPFTVHKYCSVPIAKRIILGLILVGLILYNYPLWTSKVFVEHGVDNTTHFWCRADWGFAEVLRWLTLSDMLVTLVIPSLVIIILMVAITCSLVSALKRQIRLTRGGAGSRLQTEEAKSKTCQRSSSSPQAKVTRMLFAVSFFFIVLNGPSHIIRMKMAVLDLLGRLEVHTPSVEEKLQVIFQIMYYSSFAVNLVIYLIFGDNFRKQFQEMYLSSCLALFWKTGQSNRGCGLCSRLTATPIVHLEMLDERPEEQAELIGTPPSSNRASVKPAITSYSGHTDNNGFFLSQQQNGKKTLHAHLYNSEEYQGSDPSELLSSDV